MLFKKYISAHPAWFNISARTTGHHSSQSLGDNWNKEVEWCKLLMLNDQIENKNLHWLSEKTVVSRHNEGVIKGPT